MAAWGGWAAASVSAARRHLCSALRRVNACILTKLVRLCYVLHMARKYSLYEAKTRLSEIVRQVREGGPSVTITVHGRPAVELRALDADPELKTTAERHAELERAGVIHRVEGKVGQATFPLGVKRAGALKRFLEERD